jgi:hypothetical protein
MKTVAIDDRVESRLFEAGEPSRNVSVMEFAAQPPPLKFLTSPCERGFGNVYAGDPVTTLREQARDRAISAPELEHAASVARSRRAGEQSR